MSQNCAANTEATLSNAAVRHNRFASRAQRLLHARYQDVLDSYRHKQLCHADVIIIGAGMAGIACARKLIASGISVIILEARNRLGGRIRTDYSCGVPIDMGASWIHGHRGNPMFKFAKKYNVRLHPDVDDPREYEDEEAMFDFDGTRVDPEISLAIYSRLQELIFELIMKINLYEKRLQDDPTKQRNVMFDANNISIRDALERYLGPNLDEELQRCCAAAVAAASCNNNNNNNSSSKVSVSALDPALLRRVFNAHLAAMESYCAGTADTLTMVGFKDDLPLPGGDKFVVDGYACILEQLAKGVRTSSLGCIHMNTVVTKVDYTHGHGTRGVRVTTKDGEQYTGNYCVVTVPLGVLKKQSIEFCPPLPASKTAAIQKLGFGVLDKVALLFSRPPFATSELSDETDWIAHLNLDERDRRQFPWILNLRKYHLDSSSNEKSNSQHDHACVVVCFLASDFAEAMEKLSDEEVISRAVAVLKTIYEKQQQQQQQSTTACDRRPFPELIHGFVTRWRNDPYSLGAYSNIVVGSSGSDYNVIARPVLKKQKQTRCYQQVPANTSSADNNSNSNGNLFSSYGLLFAGEATNRTYPGTVHGAYLSGIREANRILAARVPPEFVTTMPTPPPPPLQSKM